jgi:dienelactone hydrolase
MVAKRRELFRTDCASTRRAGWHHLFNPIRTIFRLRRVAAARFCAVLISLLLAAQMLVLSAVGGAAAARPGPAGPEGEPFRKQLWLVPSSDSDHLMRATVYRPRGAGPFPLVVISHGTAESAELRKMFTIPTFEALSAWFVRRGYAVVAPQRPGHGETAGPYVETNVDCENAQYRLAGLATAASIRASIDFMKTQPFVSRSPVILVGHSAGAWGSLALAYRGAGIKAVINFAGGRGGRSYNQPNRNCSPERLVAAAAEFGRRVRVPTLWIYTENDTFFGPSLSRQMAEAFRAAGGPVEYHLLPPFGEEGHFLVQIDEGVPTWGPIVARFLARLK